MLTIQDFVSKYEHYGDEDLYMIHSNIDNYSDEAIQALAIVIKEKGGLAMLIKRLDEKAVIENEKTRIGNEASLLGMQGVDAEFLKNKTTSSIFSQKEVDDIIETNIENAAFKIEDKKISSDTIAKSILGCGLASIIGSAFVSLQFIYFGATSIIMVIGLALICYGVVKFITKKSFNNPVVLLSSFLAFIISCIVGYALFSFFGYFG